MRISDWSSDVCSSDLHDERHRRAVPQAAEEHREEEVAIGAAHAVAVAAQRDVEVVAQPPRERHVPAAPEVLERQRPGGGVGVLGEPDAEQQRAAAGAVGAAGEIRVANDSVGVYGVAELTGGEGAGAGENAVDEGENTEAEE